ncbi:hypothetical protein ABH892_004492 [Paenibacillus sp. RC254]|uniref:hypothetical protein n=1 Tax=Paenibacillus TaxID=44249 RepID=UPI00042EA554|nr:MULTISPECIES: hypothetical protein [Paenibacillus]AHM66866.1 hypothetical protein PPSQR21_032270 [Paenibacillus polymyxa SQR-21]
MSFFDRLDSKIEEIESDQDRKQAIEDRKHLLSEIRSAFQELREEAANQNADFSVTPPALGTDTTWFVQYQGRSFAVFTDEVMHNLKENQGTEVKSAIENIIISKIN